MSVDNVVTGKRKRKEAKQSKVKSPITTVPTATPNPDVATVIKPTPPKKIVTNPNESGRPVNKKKSKGGPRIKVGDVVSLPATAFDGDVHG